MTVMTATKDKIVVLETDRHPLILRSNPTNAAVRGFVEEHERRFQEGLPGGPDVESAYQILSATRYTSESAYLTGAKGTAIKIQDIIQR